MCNIVRTLAQHDEYRNITRCEHGTVHLHWYRASLHMPAEDFYEVTSFLENAIHEDLPKACSPKAFYWMDRQAHYYVWLMGMGLYLSAADFLMLVDMMQQAVSNVKNNGLQQLKLESQPHAFKNVLVQLNHLDSPGTMLSIN
ncbi:MAG: hypothetical protein CSA11_11495 [Chloroflexi bacterium]|nr:MAG: hypothetical protein CSA11_11495 [Chloroflexota bacterium]